MQFVDNSSCEGPSEDLINEIEEDFQVIFPESYKHILRHHNGGVPIPRSFHFEGRDRLIEFFLPLLDDPNAPSVKEKFGWRDTQVVEAQLGSRLVDDKEARMDVWPFAGLFAGDFLCLDFRKSRRSPTIAVWFHESSRDLHPDLREVTVTFDQFLKLLQQDGG